MCAILSRLIASQGLSVFDLIFWSSAAVALVGSTGLLIIYSAPKSHPRVEWDDPHFD